MKRILIIIFTLIFATVCITKINNMFTKGIYSSKVNALYKYTVVIDAGHGGRDAGTIGVDGCNEKNINLAISLMLYDYLMVCGINSVLTRNGDYETYNDGDDKSKSDLYNRMDLVNSIDNSILISIHQNHFEDASEWGTQIWYSANTEKSKILADNILKVVKTNLQPNNKRANKISDSSYYLLYKATSPSIMVECGFMSNEEENKKLQNTKYQNDMAYSILLGVCGEV